MKKTIGNSPLSLFLNKYLLILIINYSLLINYCISQPIQEWVVRYNGPGNSYDAGRSIAIDALGNLYVTGASLGSGTNFDYTTIKYSSSGGQQWMIRYNSPGNGDDVAYSLAVDASDNVYVTGYSWVSGSNDYVTVKYSSSGVEQWVQRYRLGGEDRANAIAVDASGNVYVTGWSFGGVTDFDYATIKYSVSGDSLWVRRYNGPGNGNDKAYSLVVDSLGNVYVTGHSWGSGTGYDYATIKYNTSGDSLWVRRYNGPGGGGNDYATSLAIDLGGNIYVTGSSGGLYRT
ncbi:MAG: SBBP repeat-containing protein, partial [Ignavibacteria bacterium]